MTQGPYTSVSRVDAFRSDFAGQRVLVVGGSSGIGNAIARAFAGAGADVHVTGTRATAEHYADEPGSALDGLHFHSLDVTDPQAIGRFGLEGDRLDVLVHSQGIAIYGRAEFEAETFRRVIEVNLMSVMALSSAFHDQLSVASGRMIIISSVGAFQATLGNPAYNASKSGVTGLTRTLAKAWIRDGIRVNGIAPGYVATRMTDVTTSNPERRSKTIDRIPAGRLGEPDDIAGVALFLASDLSGFVVGQTIIADGGMLL